MGIREDQYIGLNERTQHFLELDKQDLIYVDYVNRHIIKSDKWERFEERKYGTPTKTEMYDSFYGMFDQKHALYKYTLESGKVYYEYVQYEPWSSGPMFFIALKDEDSNVVPSSQWTNDDLKEYDFELDEDGVLQ